MKAASEWDEITQHTLKEQLQEYENGRLQLREEVRDLAAELAKARSLLHTASVHLSRWVDVHDAPRQQIIEFLEGIEAPVERDERAEFESAYAEEFSKVRGCTFTADDVASMRDAAGGYGDRAYLNGQWAGWQARAALEKKSNDQSPSLQSRATDFSGRRAHRL